MITNTTNITISSDVVTAAAQDAAPSMLMGGLSSALDTVGVDKDTAVSFLGSAGAGFFALKEGYTALTTLASGLAQGSVLKNALGMAHSVKTLAMADKLAGTLSGLGNYTLHATAFVDANKLVSGLQNGNLSQAAFSGMRLCALAALGSNPVASIALAGAEFAYNRYAR